MKRLVEGDELGHSVLYARTERQYARAVMSESRSRPRKCSASTRPPTRRAASRSTTSPWSGAHAGDRERATSPRLPRSCSTWEARRGPTPTGSPAAGTRSTSWTRWPRHIGQAEEAAAKHSDAPRERAGGRRAGPRAGGRERRRRAAPRPALPPAGEGGPAASRFAKRGGRCGREAGSSPRGSPASPPCSTACAPGRSSTSPRSRPSSSATSRAAGTRTTRGRWPSSPPPTSTGRRTSPRRSPKRASNRPPSTPWRARGPSSPTSRSAGTIPATARRSCGSSPGWSVSRRSSEEARTCGGGPAAVLSAVLSSRAEVRWTPKTSWAA